MSTSHTTTLSSEIIEQKIYLIRGHKVMLDSDLALLYHDGRDMARWGAVRGSVILHGQKQPLERPRIRGSNGDEKLESYELFRREEEMQRRVWSRVMRGLTMRGYDAGETFRFATFNIAGPPDATLLPVTQAGELIDCRSGGLRLAIHSGSHQGGRFGLRSFRNATRLVTQPAFAARNGTLYLAWNNSTSTIFGDPNSNSTILFMRSIDGGNTWSNAVEVNPAVASDTQHVLPSLAIDSDPNDVHIGYYTQHNDRTLDVDPTPVSSLGFTQSGLAICNPNNSPVNLTFQLHDSSGLVVASATKTLPALGHMAQFFTDLFGGFDQFEGTVEVTSSGGPVSGVALRYDNPGGTVFATNPVIPLP